MRVLCILLTLMLAACAGVNPQLEQTAGPPSAPTPPGTAAELTAGTDTTSKSWSAAILSGEFSGATAEVVDEAISTVNSDGDTTHTHSQDDIHDYLIQFDTDLDGSLIDEAALTGAFQPLEATLTDIADGTIAEDLVNTANPWSVNEGGTGAGTHTDGSLLVGAGTGALESLAVGLTTQVLVGGGAGTNPAWGTDLPTAVTIGSAYIYRAGGTDVPDSDVADDITASNYAPLAGATFTDTVITDASDATASGLRLPHGAAPSAPTNGDLWTTTAGLYARINGATVGPYAESGGSPALNTVTNLVANKVFDNTSYTLGFTNDVTASDQYSFTSTGAIGDVSVFKIEHNTGNATNGTLLELVQTDTDIDPVSAVVNSLEVFKVDSTGLVTAAGGFAAGASDDPTITFDPSTASESEWWLGVNHDSVGDDNDPLELRQNATPGSSVRVSVGTSGVLAVLGGLDAIGAVDMDYGSADVTDHTFTTDGTGDGEIVLPNDSIGPSEIDSTTGAYDFGSVTSFELPNSTSDMTIGTEGQVGLESTDDQLVFHGGSAGEIQGEAAKSLLEHIAVAFDPSYWYDQESTYRVVPLFRVGDDFPEGFTMTEWRVVYVGGDPTTELDADIICDTTPDYNPAAGATVMDVIDTTAGASNADTGFDSGSCANGSVVYVRFGADPTDANVAIALDIWVYAEAD